MNPKPKPAALIRAYKKLGARIETKARTKLTDRKDFSLWYTPGVGTAATHLAQNPKDARLMSVKRNSIAVVSDGSAVLGLGNIGPYGALPVMEGKALIFKEMANIDAWPIVLDLASLKRRKASTQEEIDFIVEFVRALAPGWGGVNLEDISAPRCFEIEQRLQDIGIPVMHDDQHGTAVVVLAGLMNAAKVVKKDFKKLRIAISGAGAAGVAIAKLLYAAGNRHIIVCDTQGAIYRGRPGLVPHKADLATFTNPPNIEGTLSDVLRGADVFIGVSGPGTVSIDAVRGMKDGAIVFALANPVPEIMPDEALAAGAIVVATGRSDFPNQLNNALVYPGLFRGALDKGITQITEDTKLRAAKALAALVKRPMKDHIIPGLLDKRVVKAVARSVR